MKIPNSFKIANTTINVKLLDKIDGDLYGKWTDVKNEIELARTVSIGGGEIVTLSEEQIYNSFCHELIHCFQFYYNNDYSEAQAQVFANFIREYLSTQNGTIDI